MAHEGLATYILKGGEEGRARLNVQSRLLAPATHAFFDRMGSLEGLTVIDAACGGGDVTLELARRVGNAGRVIGLDLDATKLAACRVAAVGRGFFHVSFKQTDIVEPWPEGEAHLVYARLILTHLTQPEALLARAKQALVPGGRIAVEDIDFEGMFWDPPNRALEGVKELYVAAAHRRGVDPFIGRRLDRLLEGAGFCDVNTSLSQPYGREGDCKTSLILFVAAIVDAVVAAGLVSREEMAAIEADVKAYTDRPDTIFAFPRMFQAWGTRR